MFSKDPRQNYDLIPQSTLGTITRYVESHYPPGGFMMAVLSNDLTAAVSRADDQNIVALPAIVSYLYNNAPRICWGSPKRVEKWLHHTEKESL